METIEDTTTSPSIFATRPNDLKHLRACTSCHLVKCLSQFLEEFCENCWRDWAGGDLPSSMGTKDAFDIANERTTTDFEGMVSMMRPKGSWVARWLRLRASRARDAAGPFPRHALIATTLLSFITDKKVGEDGEQRMLLPGVCVKTKPRAARARAGALLLSLTPTPTHSLSYAISLPGEAKTARTAAEDEDYEDDADAAEDAALADADGGGGADEEE